MDSTIAIDFFLPVLLRGLADLSVTTFEAFGFVGERPDTSRARRMSMSGFVSAGLNILEQVYFRRAQ